MKGEKLERYLRSLPRDLRPKRDLWPWIERAIRESPRPSVVERRFPRSVRRSTLLLAGAAAAALIAGAVFLVVRRPPADDRAALIVRVQEAERQYQEAKDRLLASLRELEARYGEPAASGFAQDIAAIDREIASVKAAIARDQASEELVYRLAVLYRAEADALERASSLVYSLAEKES